MGFYKKAARSFQRITFIRCLSGAAVFLILMSGILFSMEVDSFTLVVLPDTQLYSQQYAHIFMAQTAWIKRMRDSLNIVFVIQLGDITNRNNEMQWRNASRSLESLDGIVPYGLAPGNHDLGTGGSAHNRDSSLYNHFFPASRFAPYPWFGGNYGDRNDNSYYLFEAGGMKFLALCLEFGPRDEVLQWADQVLKRFPDRRVIVSTHSYLYSDDTRVGEGDKWNPHDYGCGGNDGEEMWDKFVSRHGGIFLVLSGHILNDGLGRVTSFGKDGNPVHQILANYQMKENGGNGWLRLMTFHPAENIIRIRTYSPYLDKVAEDEQNQFDLIYEMTSVK